MSTRMKLITANRLRAFLVRLVCLVLALLLTNVDFVSAADWKAFKPAGEGFSCLLPGEPKTFTQKGETAAGPFEVHVYFIELADSAYLVNAMKIPADAEEATSEQRLNLARDGLVLNARGKLVGETKITVQGNPGRQLLVEQPAGLVAQVRMVMADNRVYQMSVMSKTSVETAQKVYKSIVSDKAADKLDPPADAKKFFDSFKLVGE